jgi:peptidoglycan/LPS O-acetylase OafA/YrhL
VAKIRELQTLRAIAIAMVSTVHFTVLSVVTKDSTLYPFGNFFAPIFPLLSQGRLGVELFFMVSGFVISLTLKSSTSIGNFWTKRAVRLWVPLSLLLPLVWIVAMLSPKFAFSSSRLIDLLTSMSLIDPNLVNSVTSAPGLVHATTSVTWTLWIELQFYLVASIAHFRTNSLSRSLSVLAVPMLFLALLSRTHFWLPLLHGGLGGIFISLTSISPYFAWFLAGVCVHEIRSRQSVPSVGYISLYVGCWISTCLSEFSDANYFWFFIVNLSIFALFWLLAKERDIPLLQCSFLVKIGEISYEYYLIHEAMGIALMWWIGHTFQVNSPLLALIPMLILLPFSYLVFEWWSRPAIKLARNYLLRASS